MHCINKTPYAILGVPHFVGKILFLCQENLLEHFFAPHLGYYQKVSKKFPFILIVNLALT